MLVHVACAHNLAGRLASRPVQGVNFNVVSIGLRASSSVARHLLVYGANTDVGKTVVSAGLCLAASTRGLSAHYLKPIQTGTETDAAAMLRHCSHNSAELPWLVTKTLFHFAAPESPATAAEKEGRKVTDIDIRTAVNVALDQVSPSQGGVSIIETAGGPLTPAPSSTAQADVYAPLKLSCVVVGDSKLGGISATLCAFEALAARQQLAKVLLFMGGDHASGNAEAVRKALSNSGHQPHIVVVPQIPSPPAPLDDWFRTASVSACFVAVLDAVMDPQAPLSESETAEEYVAFDQQHLWHPYSSMARPGHVWPVRSANGCKLELEDGRQLVDGMSSWWCAVHGYNVPALNAAISRQLSQMSHVMFGGLTHRPAAELGQVLVSCAPTGLDKVFLCDSGSISVEVSLKMALQYWAVQGRPQKSRIATVRCGYHGDTFGAMAVCDPTRGMHTLFRGVLPQHLFADAPLPSQDGAGKEVDDGFGSMQQMLRENADEVAAVIIEPIVQGAGGMRIYAPSYLVKLRALCDELDILLIFDEIATGFGRTGRLFAAEHAAVTPDIMCIGKALSGGYCTIGATMTTDQVAQGVSGGGSQPLMHGPTFMANPLSSAVSAASVKLLLDSPWKQRTSEIERQLRQELMPLRGSAGVADVRVLGAIGVVELMAPPKDAERLQADFVQRGVWLRPFGNLVYCMPPFTISKEELGLLTSAMVETLGSGIELQSIAELP